MKTQNPDLAVDAADSSRQERHDRAARHWVGLTGVETIPTKGFAEAQLRLRRVVSVGGIAAVSGDSGCGKTFAVDYFVHHDPAMVGRELRWVVPPRNCTTKALAVIMARKVGLVVNTRDSEFMIGEELVLALRAQRPVIAVDEAQFLKVDALQQLRYFHDRCAPSRPGEEPGWSLLLVGSTVHRSLGSAAELENRVAAWMHFERLDKAELLVAVRQWHPLLRDMDPRMLLRINEEHGRGNWRNWAQFLASYTDAAANRPPSNDHDRALLAKAAIKDCHRSAR